ncbi:hypothetical protein RhiirA4_485205 [Rhizophagus irregularis]|uniref:Uncharacterized protein n=1 Tax=Rhizophagus irregularis TaxID=588596 RepID=A0A2I1HPW4_9GLOM|nr:hypothetical protein RhiirA4_485205 [Rhizophagus irregularis]
MAHIQYKIVIIKIGQQLCHSHYMSIVEPYHTQKSEFRSSFFLESDKENLNCKY